MRTRYSVYNFLVSAISSILLPLFGFIKVRMFIDLYGSDLNGLQLAMMNIITFLNICELAYSLAFRQLLFKPLAENDHAKVRAIYRGAQKIFKTTGFIVLALGFIIAMFFPMLQESPLSYAETSLMFLVAALPFGLSYFLMGPNFVIIADQKEYKINIWIQGIVVLRMVIMIAAIYLKAPYYVIFIIEGLQVFIANLIARKVALKAYPWLNERCKTEEVDKQFFKNARYTVIQRLATLATTNTDNIVISYFMGYTSVSIFGNYSYLTDSVSKIINSAITSPINSFGNLFNDKGESAYDIFCEFFNFAIFIASIISICIFVVMPEFVLYWLGQPDIYHVSLLLALLFSINIFYLTMREPIIISRDANGLFKEAKNNAYLLAITKIILSIFLVQNFGFVGILFATCVCNWIIDFLYNPILVYKRVYHINFTFYYRMVFTRLAVAIIVGMVSYLLWQTFYVSSGMINFFISAIILGIFVTVMMTIVYMSSYRSFRKLCVRFISMVSHKHSKEVQHD